VRQARRTARAVDGDVRTTAVIATAQGQQTAEEWHQSQ